MAEVLTRQAVAASASKQIAPNGPHVGTEEVASLALTIVEGEDCPGAIEVQLIDQHVAQAPRGSPRSRRVTDPARCDLASPVDSGRAEAIAIFVP